MRHPHRLQIRQGLRFSLFVTSVALVAACDKGAEPAAGGGDAKADAPAEAPAAEVPAAEAPAAEAPAAEAPTKGELAKNTFVKPTKEAFEKAKSDYKAHLNAGRKSVKEKDYASGIAELKLAKMMAPTNASVLGELGWAHFNAGHLDDAQRELTDALEQVTKDTTKGALLYNLGRVHEARGNKEIAGDLYRQSLVVRPNDVVQSRLEGLGLGAEVAHAACLFEAQGTAPGSLCDAFVAKLNADGATWECTYNKGTTAAAATPATVFSVSSMDEYVEVFVVAVVVGDQWWTSDLAVINHPGAGYADESMEDVDVDAVEVTGAGKPEARLKFRWIGHDMDPGVEYMEDWTYGYEAYVTVDDGQPKWVANFAVMGESTSGDMDPNEWGAMVDPSTSKYTYTVKPDNAGNVEVSLQGEADDGMKAGTYPINEAKMRCPVETSWF